MATRRTPPRAKTVRRWKAVSAATANAGLDELLRTTGEAEIAPDTIVSNLAIGVPQAVKERVTGRWK